MKEQETDIKHPDPDKPLLSDKHGRCNICVLTFNKSSLRHICWRWTPFLKALDLAFFSSCLEKISMSNWFKSFCQLVEGRGSTPHSMQSTSSKNRKADLPEKLQSSKAFAQGLFLNIHPNIRIQPSLELRFNTILNSEMENDAKRRGGSQSSQILYSCRQSARRVCSMEFLKERLK